MTSTSNGTVQSVRILILALVTICGGATGIAADDIQTEQPRRLTDDGTLKLAPEFVPGGDEIVYSTHESPNLVSIWRLSLAGGARQRLHPTVADHQFDPTYSLDGRYHVYAMSQTSPQLVLVIQDLQQQTAATFRPRESRATARSPATSPDGARVYFSLSDVRGHQIASVDASGQDLQLLTETSGMNCWPACSPDGRQIAFGTSRDGDFEIYVMDAGGGNPRRLTHSPGRDMRPTWSPDGRYLAFTSCRDGNEEVYVMDADGSHPVNVTQHADRDDFPAWHPDGEQILTVSERQGRTDLYLFALRRTSVGDQR